MTTANPATAANFGTTHPDHARRYEMASEFLDVVKGLWDGWADDAIVTDRVSGLYIDPTRPSIPWNWTYEWDSCGRRSVVSRCLIR